MLCNFHKAHCETEYSFIGGGDDMLRLLFPPQSDQARRIFAKLVGKCEEVLRTKGPDAPELKY